MNKEVHYAVIDCRMSKKCRDYLISRGLKLIEIPECELLDYPVSSHPDMSAVKIDDCWFIANDVYKLFTFSEIRIKVSREAASCDNKLVYPHDTTFNCAVFGNNIVCNTANASTEVIDFAKQHGYRVINVKQGYAKCSICVVSDNAIITEDSGIAKVCLAYGIDVLKLESHSVKLVGYDYGFIGGASGKIYDNELLFCGRIENHPEYDSINRFCKKYNVLTVSMSDEPLYDVGSIYFSN